MNPTQLMYIGWIIMITGTILVMVGAEAKIDAIERKFIKQGINIGVTKEQFEAMNELLFKDQ